MQLVDFYFDEYRPKPLSFDLRFAGAIILVVVAGLVAIGIIQTNQISEYQDSLVKKQVEFKTLSEETLKLQKKLAESRDFQELDSAVARQTETLNQYRKAFANLNLPDQGNTEKFSQILDSLSERKVNAVWLTKIDISQQNLSLFGSTTKRDSVPLYVEDLKNATSLNREFDELSIRQNEDNKRILDFALINGRKINE